MQPFMSQNNQERVGQALEKLNRGLRPFVTSQMQRNYGPSWQQEVRRSLPERHRTRRGLHLDTQALFFIIRDQWDSVFSGVLGPEERRIVGELLAARNKWAHQETFSNIEVERLLRNVEHLLTRIGFKESSSQQTFNWTGTTHPNPPSGNQTWPDLPNLPRPARTSFLHFLEDKLLGLPSSPMPARTTGQPRVSRRNILILALVAAGGVSICLCGQALQEQSAVQPDQTAAGQETTATAQVRPLFTYKGHAKAVNAVAWSLPDGKRIASGSDDTTVQVWDASDGNHRFTYHGHSDVVKAVAWSPDGKRVASGSGDPSDNLADNTVQVWNASDGNHRFTYQGHSAEVNAVAWSPDGKRIASGSDDSTMQVWNASDGSHLFTHTGQSDEVEAVAWSPDGKRIAFGSWDNTVQVWNASGSHLFTYQGHSGVVEAVAWSLDGKHIASGSDDQTVQVWNASNGSNVLTYTGHSNTVNAVAWSPDGKRVASGSDDQTVQVWNASDGSNVLTYTGHSNTVNAVAWSPDGERIASGSSDTTVQVWQAV